MASTAPSLFSTLALHSLKYKVRLGCTPEERSVPQGVRFDIQIRFESLPGGSFNDDLNETICYAKLSNRARVICDMREYQLIEKLGWDAFSALKEIIPPNVKLWLRVTKEKPPVAELEGGASFSVGEWI